MYRVTWAEVQGPPLASVKCILPWPWGESKTYTAQGLLAVLMCLWQWYLKSISIFWWVRLRPLYCQSQEFHVSEINTPYSVGAQATSGVGRGAVVLGPGTRRPGQVWVHPYTNSCNCAWFSCTIVMSWCRVRPWHSLSHQRSGCFRFSPGCWSKCVFVSRVKEMLPLWVNQENGDSLVAAIRARHGKWWQSVGSNRSEKKRCEVLESFLSAGCVRWDCRLCGMSMSISTRHKAGGIHRSPTLTQVVLAS